MSHSGQQLDADDVFDVLANRRRRFVLNFLLREERPVTIQELSQAVAEWEFDAEAEELTDQQQKRIYVALYQTHVPKLADLGIVEYDPDTNLVELTDTATQLRPYVEEEAPRERPWALYYLGLTIVGLATYGAVQLGIPGVAILSVTQVGLGVLLAFLALAVAHYLERRR